MEPNNLVAQSLTLNRVEEIAKSLAKEHGHANFSSPHLLNAVLHKDAELLPFLDELGKDVYYMRDWAEMRLEKYPKATGKFVEPVPDDLARTVFREADVYRIKLKRDAIDPLCLLASLSTPGVGFSYEQLKTFPLNHNELIGLNAQTSNEDNESPVQSRTVEKQGNPKDNSALSKFCRDKTKEASEKNIPPVIARDKEVRMITEILGRRTKPNVIILGDPGVGKTALVEGFVQNIADGKVQENLKDAKVFELDLGALLAGASYRGEVEDRLKNILAALKQYNRAILFIDEIHGILDQQRGLTGCANLLKPELSRGDLTVIGATTNEDYREHVETDQGFSRRFELLRIEEPDESSCIRMIKAAIPHFESHHQISIQPEAVNEAVRLAKRFVRERKLPDSAIDLIDRTMSSFRMMRETTLTELEHLKTELETLIEKDIEDEKDFIAELKWMYRLLQTKISPLLLGRLTEETNIDDLGNAQDIIAFLERTFLKIEELHKEHEEGVGKNDIAAVVSHKTGIPIGKVVTQEKERLLNMEEILQARVIGQSQAVSAMSASILESRSGLLRGNQPIGSFFFLGPTGTGKTELAKTLAEFLFADETALIRFDMSEFKEEHSAALLYGAPPGYVGYKEGGLLVNKIRQKPYAVVLFDEIEKAHNSVFDVFLQILDEGKLHDRLGREGDFSNAVIIFTSNIGSQHIEAEFAKGKVPLNNDLMEAMGKHFRPEFLGRLTEILPFRPISKEMIVKIFEIQLKQLTDMLALQGITLTLTPEAREKLAMDGYTPKYGARPLRTIIQNMVRRPVSRKIIAGEVKKGHTIKLEIEDGNSNLVWTIEEQS